MSDTLQTLLFIFGAIGALFVGYYLIRAIDYVLFRPRRVLDDCVSEVDGHAKWLKETNARTRALEDKTDLIDRRLQVALENFQTNQLTKGHKHVSR